MRSASLHRWLAWAALLGVAPGCAPPEEPFPPAGELPVIPDLPDPFLERDGVRVSTPARWHRHREMLKEMFRYYEFGHAPPAPSVAALALEEGDALDHAAVRRELRLTLGPGGAVSVRLLLFVPKQGPGPFPVIVNNVTDPGPILQEIIGRGYALAAFDRTDLATEARDRRKGVFPHYDGYDWATLQAWAWGTSRVIDHLLTLDAIDRDRVIVTGFSRGGKAALLAGAMDERIALTNPVGSGAGGCAPYRFVDSQGPEPAEDLGVLTRSHGSWFHRRLRDFVGQEERLPFDHHTLKALVAPRLLLCADALGDHWANPEGNRMTHAAAREVFSFLGVPDHIGIHFREGGHGHEAEDWRALLDFADEHLRPREVIEARLDY